jgi:hypothetical protein
MCLQICLWSITTPSFIYSGSSVIAWLQCDDKTVFLHGWSRWVHIHLQLICNVDSSVCCWPLIFALEWLITGLLTPLSCFPFTSPSSCRFVPSHDGRVIPLCWILCRFWHTVLTFTSRALHYCSDMPVVWLVEHCGFPSALLVLGDLKSPIPRW